MRILLTGATGLLGNNVLEQLLVDGYEVTALVRDPSRVVVDISRYSGRYRFIIGDLTRIEELMSAAKGCTGIVNCAGMTDMTHKRIDDFLPINRDLCQNLLLVAQREGIETIVHVSTADTVGYGSEERAGFENCVMRAPFTRSYYALSKNEGEKVLLQWAENHSPRVVIINPGYIIGKHDVKPSSGRMLLAGWRHRVMVAPPGGKSFVGAHTVAKAVVAALRVGKSGERYLVTGETLTFKQLYELQARLGGYRQLVLELPRWLCLALGAVGNIMEKIGFRVEFTSRNIDQLLIEEHYDNRKMREELKIEAQPIEEAVREFLTDRNLI